MEEIDMIQRKILDSLSDRKHTRKKIKVFRFKRQKRYPEQLIKRKKEMKKNLNVLRYKRNKIKNKYLI